MVVLAVHQFSELSFKNFCQGKLNGFRVKAFSEKKSTRNGSIHLIKRI